MREEGRERGKEGGRGNTHPGIGDDLDVAPFVFLFSEEARHGEQSRPGLNRATLHCDVDIARKDGIN